jgi:hypothetical protein
VAGEEPGERAARPVCLQAARRTRGQQPSSVRQVCHCSQAWHSNT